MSDEQQLDNSDFGRPGIEKAAGYVEMPGPTAETGSDTAPLATPADRHLARQEIPEPEELFYQDKTGEKLPDNLTIERERGADDLSAVRRAKQAEIERAQNEELNQALDYLKQQVEAPPHQQPQQAQQPPGIDQPQPDEIQYQQEQAAVADAEKRIEEVLKDPWVRQRIETEFNGVKAQAAAEIGQHQQAYHNAITHNAFVGLAILNNAFPELSGLNPEQINGALRVMQPQRAEQYRQHVAQVSTLVEGYRREVGAALQQQREQQMQQQQRAAQEFEFYKREQGKKVDAAIPLNDPIRNNVFELTERHYGIPEARMRALASDPHLAPLIHSAEFQMILYEGLKAREARQSLAAHRNNPVPAVARPGVSEAGSRSDDGEVAALWSKLNSNNKGLPGIRAAAELVAARRRARG